MTTDVRVLDRLDKPTIKYLREKEQREAVLNAIHGFGGGLRDFAVAGMQNEWFGKCMAVVAVDNLIRFKVLDPNPGRAMIAMILAFMAAEVTEKGLSWIDFLIPG